MSMRKFKAYLRLTCTYTLVFAIVAFTAFSLVLNMMDGKFLGYEFGSSSKSYKNVLLLGVDKDEMRTDVIILAHLNMKEHVINLLQIPRDTYVADNGRRDRKINSGWGYKKEKTVFAEVQKVTGVEVKDYVLVNTSQFRNIIDAIGGVEFDVPINMNYDDPYQNLHIHLEKGPQILDGDKAEQFVRFRRNNNGSGYANGDIDRLEAQKGFIKATIRELFSFSNVTKIPKLVSIFSSMIDTNMSNSEMISNATHVFKVKQENINIMTLAGEGGYRGGVSYFLPYERENREIISKYFTPDSENMNEEEERLLHEVEGDNGIVLDADPEKMVKKSIFNRMINIDIIDASNGLADIDRIKEDIEYYGFEIADITETTSSVYNNTVVVVKRNNGTGDKIANLLGVPTYTVNEDKANKTDVTIILGKDMS